MVFFLVLGVLIGAVSIIFVLQNITPVTVTFFAYQIDGSLALILFIAMVAGMLVSVLILLPSFIRDEFRVSRLLKRNQELEGELLEAKNNLHEMASRPTVMQSHTPAAL